MAESVSHGPLINPCFFHLKKLELELKCPMCLHLLKRPVLLPCDHLFCSSCISCSSDGNTSCLICTVSILPQELRFASHMESMVNIYKSMSAAFSANFGQPRVEINSSDVKRSIETSQNYGRTIVEEKSQSPNLPRDGVKTDPAQCSPPSFAGPKYSEDDSNDQGSVHGSDSQINPNFPGQTTEFKEGQCREPKRLKLTREDLSKTCGIEKPTNFVSAFYSESDDQVVISAMPCAFCQSSKESEASGPMFHYINGAQVDVKHASSAHALHAHQKCIEWAPQVYFVEENAKNLEAEISRASKIKCSKCGKKGAALGCYYKSCRKSFHVPCAVEVPGCRWDSDNFLVLCPSHASRKLPNDKPKKRDHNQSPSNVSKMGEVDSELWSAPPEATREWVLCGSALSPGDKDIVAKFASLTGAMLTKDWRPSVTHVVASTDSYGACSRTLKFLMAILSGKWIVTVEWIKACLYARRPVEECSFEVSHDIHGCFDGPKNGRIRLLEQAPKLFSGLSFYLTGDFMPTYKGYLRDLVFAAGGDLMEENSKMLKSRGYVVYSVDPPLEVDSADTQDVMDRRLLEANELAARIGAQLVPHTWILDSIAACKIQSISL